MIQQPFAFALPKSTWTAPKLTDLPTWSNAKRIAIDVETKDPQLRELGPGNFRPGNHIIGISFAIEDGPAHYLPIRHEGGGNMDVQHVLAYVRDQAATYGGTLVGTNLAYDLGFLRNDKIRFPKVEWFRDVASADVLINELHFKYSLDAICERRSIPGKDESDLRAFAAAYGVDPKSDMWKLPGHAAASYAIQDVRAPLRVLRKQELDIDITDERGRNLWPIWNLESKVLPVLVDVRERGIDVDVDRIIKVRDYATRTANEHLAESFKLSGIQLRLDEVWNAKAMARVLIRAGYKLPTTKGGQPSITKNTLKQCGAVGMHLGRARDISKLNQFADRTLRYQINGRVHPVFHQLRMTKEESGAGEGEEKGARFGRFSCEHYNIQQEPGRDDEFATMWRDVYVPKKGCFWLSSDWSQQEPRFAVHYAELLGLPGAKEFADQYRREPRTDCHQLLSDMVGIPRKIVKNYFNGCIYGMGDGKLCVAIGHPVTTKQLPNGRTIVVPGETGGKIIKQFRDMMPWVGMLTKEAGEQAKKHGVVWTILGRRCNFPRKLDGSGEFDWIHKAFSRIGQGGAADQMKATLVAAHAAGLPVEGIIHDEYIGSFESEAQVMELKQLQLDTVKIGVPQMVDSEVGTSWGKAKKIQGGQGVRNMMQAIRRLVGI